ncbi:MAG: hypothetical protein GY850_25945 [bacterium]|nr:hypothetical protein [bacterium]
MSIARLEKKWFDPGTNDRIIVAAEGGGGGSQCGDRRATALVTHLLLGSGSYGAATVKLEVAGHWQCKTARDHSIRRLTL